MGRLIIGKLRYLVSTLFCNGGGGRAWTTFTPPRAGGTITATFKYGGRVEPLPVEDPWAGALREDEK